MKTRWLLAIALFMGLIVQVPRLQAQITYYWDNNGSAGGFGAAGGTWATATTNDGTQGWSTDPTGLTLPTGAAATVSTGVTDRVNFGTDTTGFGLAAGTVNVSG